MLGADAGTTKVTFYRVFESKDDLIVQVLEEQSRVFWEWWDGIVAEFPGEYASGLGFLPSGDLLVVLMASRRIMRVSNGRQTLHADLTPFTPFLINDMAVGANGRAYVSQPGFDM